MVAPSFVETVTTPLTDAGGAWTFDITVENPYFFVIHMLQDGSTSGAVAVTSVETGLFDIAGNDGALTYLGAFPVGSPTAAYQHIWLGRRGASSGFKTISGTNSTSEDLYISVYRFADVSTGTTLVGVIENGSGRAMVAQNSGENTAVFGTVSSTQMQAQSFTATGPIEKVALALATAASPTDNVVVEIQTNNGGVPSGTVLASASVLGSSLPSTIGTLVPFVIPCDLTSGTKYWIVARRSGALDDINYYNWGLLLSSGYSGGEYASYVSAWTANTSYDHNFVVYEPFSTAGDTSNTAALPDITTLGPDRLALALVAVNDDNNVGGIGTPDFSWLVITQYAESSGTDGAIALMRATVTSASTDSGTTVGVTDSDAWGVVGFALIGTTVEVVEVPRGRPMIYPPLLAQ